MSKPTSGQIVYIDLSGSDTAEVYAAGGSAALNGLTDKVSQAWATRWNISAEARL